MASNTTLTGGIESEKQLEVGNRTILFDTITSEELKMQSDITDQYIEDNSTIQDHIAIKPTELTIRGLVAEISYVKEPQEVLEKALLEAQEEAKIKKSVFEIAGNIAPILSNYMNVAIGVANYVQDTVSKITHTYPKAEEIYQKSKQKVLNGVNKVKNKLGFKEKEQNNLVAKDMSSASGTEQLQVSAMLKDYMENRKPVQWSNSYGIFESYYITNFTLTQSESKYVSELSISLKQLRTTQTQTTTIDYSNYSEKYGQQQAQMEDLGNQQGTYELMSTKYMKKYNINGYGR